MIDIEGFHAYLCEEELSQNTIRSYLFALRQFSRMYPEMDKASLIAYKQYLVARVKPATVNLRLTALLSYCRCKGIPMKVKTVKVPRRTHIDNVITSDQLEQLLAGLRRDRNRSWEINILLLARTGMRVSEALRVRKRDIVFGSVTMYTKSHLRTIYFPKSLTADIRGDLDTLAADDFVMRGRYGRPVTAKSTVESALRVFAERYGIPKEVMHPHSFRHFFAIEFLKRRNDIAMLADLLGHGSVNMTRIYLRQSQEQQKDVLDETVDW